MSSPAEAFVIALGRAAKRSHRILRGLSKEDRDDVISTAILECWEQRSTYKPTESLETWFGAVLWNARRRFNRQEHITHEEFTDEMGVPDETVAYVEALEAAQAIARSCTAREHTILLDRVDGDSWRDVMRKHSVSGQEVGAITAKLNKLRDLLPDPRDIQRTVWASRKQVRGVRQSDESRIDREIAKLDFAPPAGSDCPPCWRCMYFEGWQPARYAARTTTPADAELQAAIWATEQQKISIAEAVSCGTIRSEK